MTTPSLPSTDGSLFFDETGESIGPRTTPDLFETTKLRRMGSLTLATDRSTCKLAERTILGDRFNVTFTFKNMRLWSIDLYPHRPADAKDWSGWTLEAEMSRKAWVEDWAARVFGKPLTIKPFVLDELPEPVYPATPGPEHPRHALFDWGEVCSYFDSKAGFAGIWIAYNV